jgi:outer membrane protein OmpA-like peptidoglycan-associated protein
MIPGKIIFFAGVFLLAPFFVQAQSEGHAGLPSRSNYNTWIVGLGVGPLIYQGDMNPKVLEDSDPDLGFGFMIGKNFTHGFGLQLHGLFGKLTGENRWYNFEAPFWEATVQAHLTIGNISFLKRNQNLNIYAFLGGGMIGYESEARWNLGDSLFNKVDPIREFTLPIGIGAKYKISERLHTSLSLSYRRTLTDKIDALENRLSEFDGYSWVRVGLTYSFGGRRPAIEWVNPLQTLYSDFSDMRSQMDLLTMDSDGDGVSDFFDKDMSTPEGVKVYGDGTAVDTDGDGIPDYMDEEPFTPKGAVVDERGRAIDSDGDGVPDHLDKEPNTPPGSIVNFQGITIPTGGAVGSGYLPAVFFDFDRSNIKYQYYDNLAGIAKLLRANPNVNMVIIGHADHRGNEQYNERLARRRAEAVRDHLVKIYNIDAARLSIESKGETDPLAAPELPGQNRRVDFSFTEN